MVQPKYSRIDNKKSSSSYCSTVTVVVFVALCLVGVWILTSSSAVTVDNIEETTQDNNGDFKEQVPSTINESITPKKTEDNPVDLPQEDTQGDDTSVPELPEENIEKKPEEQKTTEEAKLDDEQKTTEEAKLDDEPIPETKDGDKNDDSGTEETKKDVNEGDFGEQGDPQEKSEEKKSDSDDDQKKSDSDDGEKNKDEGNNEPKSEEKDIEVNSDGKKGDEKVDDQIEEKVDQKEKKETEEIKEEGQVKNQTLDDAFPSGEQTELSNETMSQNASFSTQAKESKDEKEAQLSSEKQTGYSWKICNTTAGPDFIPCLDNWQAIRSLRSTKHYEHRERHCPEKPPTCLVPLPEGYKFPIEWPKSREKIWYNNVPHTKLAEIKGHQNWVKVTGEYLTFPGGGTQFKQGALHYIEFVQESVPDINWGKRSRVILDVGCGVASFGGFLFDKDVLTMSFAPKDEHEAQVQFALERGIPGVSAVMGTQRLPFPGRVFDIVHCARCRVPWHIEGGKLLLELNRVLRPGGFFVWSATPVYQKLPEDVGIWNAMTELMKKMCWELVARNRDTVNKIGVAIYRKPTSNECYENRTVQEPSLCSHSDDPNAAWNVPLQTCMHKVPVDAVERGSKWPEQWPARLEKPPYWLLNSQVGVYGKAAPEDFTVDYEHWKRVVTKSYLNGMGIKWNTVRNVMDMRAVYGGFAAALKELQVWVMNVVPIDSPDTLPIIYERGLFGVYHDWCETFNTYPRSYDLLHADHLFSKTKKRCGLVGVIAEVDRILRPGGKLILRDNLETINEVETIVSSMQWEVKMSYSKDKEGLLCVQKSMWRPTDAERLSYAIV